MPSRLSDTLQKKRPKISFDLGKINFPIASQDDIEGVFLFLIKSRGDTVTTVFRKCLYEKSRLPKEDFIRAIKRYACSLVDVPERGFSRWARTCMAEYILKFSTSAEERKLAQLILKEESTRRP